MHYNSVFWLTVSFAALKIQRCGTWDFLCSGWTPTVEKDWGEFLNVLSHSGLSPSSLKQDICPYEGNECVFTSSDPFPLKLCNIKIHSRKTLVEAFRVSPPFVSAINGI